MTDPSPGPFAPSGADRSGNQRPGAESPRWIAITPGNVRRTVAIALVMLVGLQVGIWAFQSLSNFLFILLLAWLLSIAMEPPVLWLSRHGMKRGLASGLVMLAMLVLVVAVGALFGQLFLAQFTQLAVALPGAVTAVVDWINSTFNAHLDSSSIAEYQPNVAQLTDLAQQYGGGLLGVFGSLLAFVFDALTILVFAYYLSADSPSLRQTIGSWMPPRYQPVLVTVWTIAVEKTGGYVISKVVLAALSATFHAAFFWWIDVPFWFPLGVLAGIVGQFIPTIGTYIGVALPALFAVLYRPLTVLWIVLFATVYQQVENYWFTPKISRRTMDVHPAVALGSVIAGAALFGPVGALIGIPVAAALITIVETFTQRHELLPELAELADDPERGRRPEERGDPGEGSTGADAADPSARERERAALGDARRELDEMGSAG